MELRAETTFHPARGVKFSIKTPPNWPLWRVFSSPVGAHCRERPAPCRRGAEATFQRPFSVGNPRANHRAKTSVRAPSRALLHSDSPLKTRLLKLLSAKWPCPVVHCNLQCFVTLKRDAGSSRYYLPIADMLRAHLEEGILVHLAQLNNKSEQLQIKLLHRNTRWVSVGGFQLTCQGHCRRGQKVIRYGQTPSTCQPEFCRSKLYQPKINLRGKEHKGYSWVARIVVHEDPNFKS